jgi:hypothetical protein
VSLLLDTTLLIAYFRDAPAAVAFIERIEAVPSLPVVNVAELFAGVRDDQEQRQLDSALAQFHVLSVTSAIAREAGLLKRRWGASHGVGLADALIAATAQVHRLQLVTRNRKHFPMLEDVLTPY